MWPMMPHGCHSSRRMLREEDGEFGDSLGYKKRMSELKKRKTLLSGLPSFLPSYLFRLWSPFHSHLVFSPCFYSKHIVPRYSIPWRKGYKCQLLSEPKRWCLWWQRASETKQWNRRCAWRLPLQKYSGPKELQSIPTEWNFELLAFTLAMQNHTYVHLM